MNARPPGLMVVRTPNASVVGRPRPNANAGPAGQKAPMTSAANAPIPVVARHGRSPRAEHLQEAIEAQVVTTARNAVSVQVGVRPKVRQGHEALAQDHLARKVRERSAANARATMVGNDGLLVHAAAHVLGLIAVRRKMRAEAMMGSSA